MGGCYENQACVTTKPIYTLVRQTASGFLRALPKMTAHCDTERPPEVFPFEIEDHVNFR